MRGSFRSGGSGPSTWMRWGGIWERWTRRPLRKEGRDMNAREQYAPGPASGAEVQKDGEEWTPVVIRDLAHAPEKVWKALTGPEHLREWAPFDSDRSLGAAGTA